MSDAELEALLGTHNAAILAFVASLRAEGEKQPEGTDKEKESLLKRNAELAAILGHSQKECSEKDVRTTEEVLRQG